MKRKNRILTILFLIIIHFTNAQKKCNSSNEYLEDLHSIKKCALKKKVTSFTEKSVDISIEKPLSRRNLLKRKRLKKTQGILATKNIDSIQVKKIRNKLILILLNEN